MRFDDRVSAGGVDAWTVIIPVKQLSAAKSRMGDAGFPAVDTLALAFFQDTATAALSCPLVDRVVVATSDTRVADWARAAGCHLVDDRDHPGINAAALAAIPSDASRVAVVVSDLPCATPDALSTALDLAEGRTTAFLADAAGTGTTVWTRVTYGPGRPRFGIQSRAAHRAESADDLVDAVADDAALSTRLEPMRRDVDTPADLADALRLGVGRFTAAAVAQVENA